MQRQLRLGDILDDYCPRERRVTNHAVVAMVGSDVKQTRCTTCDTEHEYKHARVPRQRRKPDTPAALYSQVLAGGPKRVTAEPAEPSPAAPGETPGEDVQTQVTESQAEPESEQPAVAASEDDAGDENENGDRDNETEGPIHRRLIRATLPRPEGQPPPQRPAPEFTIRQPGGRPGRFRHRHGGHGPQQFQGGRSNGHMPGGPHRGGGGMRQGGGGRPPLAGRGNRQGRKRSK